VTNYSLSKRVLRCRASAGCGWKVVLPAAMVPIVFHHFRSGPVGGHLGVLKTVQKHDNTLYVKEWLQISVTGYDIVRRVKSINRHKIPSLVSGCHNLHSDYFRGYLLVTLESFLGVKQESLCCYYALMHSLNLFDFSR
jgi:hypothetical protein